MARKRRGRGEGSIYQEADGRWTACVSLGYVKGKRRRKKVRGKSKAQVAARIAELHRQGAQAGAEGLLVGKYLTDWLQEQCDKGKIGPTSRVRYETCIRLHLEPFWARTLLLKAERSHVELFLTEMREAGLPPATQVVALRILNTAFNSAVKKELIPANPCAKVDKPDRQGREIHPLDEAQSRRLLDAAKDHDLYALFVLALAGGFRIGELLALHWPDVDLDKGTVQVRFTVARVGKEVILKKPKTAAGRRTVVIPAEAVEALRQHRQRREAAGLLDKSVFCTKSGKYTRREFPGGVVLRRLLKRADLPKIKFHDLRHSHASILLSRGCSIRAVASRLGHKKTTVTLAIYAHTMPNDDATLAEAVGKALSGSIGS
jgi:integrase